MDLITTRDEFESTVMCIKHNSKPSFIYISTFNIKVGKFMDSILSTKCPIKIIIGHADMSKKQRIFLDKWFSNYPNVKVRYRKNYHTKFILTDKAVIVGGRNLTESGWDDISLLMRRKETLDKFKKYFDIKFK